MSTLTAEQEQRIAQFLDGRYIPSGLGTKEQACSIAAINLALRAELTDEGRGGDDCGGNGDINLALRGELTDEIPPCMSPVIGQWIIAVQDRMPDTMRNSEAWRKLLPLAAGSAAPEKERARVEIILGWMWKTVLPSLQWIADAHGFGQEWRAMCEERSQTAADAAADVAARAVTNAVCSATRGEVAWVRDAADAAAGVAARVEGEVAWVWDAAGEDVARAVGEVAGPAAEAALVAARKAARAEAVHAAWEGFAPVALLEQLIAV